MKRGAGGADIEVKDMEFLVLKDEEIEELTQDINFENIKVKAMKEIRREKKKMKKSIKKITIIAAAILTIGGTVFAAEYADNFKLFYGEKTNITSEDKTMINKQQTTSGIKMTVQEGIIGDKSAIIMVAFEKEDGTIFPKDARVKTLEFLRENKQGYGYMVGQQVTEDGLRLIGSFEIETSDSLNGQKVVIQADEIYEESTQKSIAKGPWKRNFKVDATNGVQKKAIDLKLTEQGEALKLDLVCVSALGIEIQGERLDGIVGKLPEYVPVVKIKMTDGRTMELKTSSTFEIDKGFKWQYNMDANNNIIFIDDKKIESITIDGEVINTGV